MWTDTVGRLGLRALQVLLIGTVVGPVVVALLRVTLVGIPVVLGVILACALWPAVRLCRRVMSHMLAAWTVFLGSLLVIGGLGTGLVVSVMTEWSRLVAQAVAGFN